ncbi:PREDICTED: coiled-coil domain-containing protein 36 [Nanorana parkeri]|uniref:coiled-coil domain-containing protein 36 n=1 Tax=Nanorana parkeri TaxID=125878 RepID=UPI000854F462|nr:PREDICTED: coiled-coil domain-containing protein 36 [Nanorana parkeri]
MLADHNPRGSSASLPIVRSATVYSATAQTALTAYSIYGKQPLPSARLRPPQCSPIEETAGGRERRSQPSQLAPPPADGFKMNLNVWNIKDMFSIPPGAGAYKSSNRNGASSDHSSLTDSQFLFSSQCCPENSQPGSVDYKSQTNYQRNSNPNSQESEPGMYQKYRSKPPLCCTDSKERGPFQTFGKGNSKSIIEQFEESKRKAKEKYESEQLNQLICQVHVTVQELKMTLCHVEENTNLKCKSILDSMDATSKALQQNIASYHESMQKMQNTKCSCRQMLLDLENKILLKDAELTDLKSNVQLLVKGMDAMKSQQCEKHLELSEKLTWLSNSIKSSEDKILSEIHNLNCLSKPACHLKENTTQTSPASVQDLPAEEHSTSQYKTRTFVDCSALSQSSVQNTWDRISDGCSSSLTGFKGVTTRSAQSAESTGNCCITLESPGDYPGSNTGGRRVHFSKGVTTDDRAVRRLQQFYHNDHCVPAAQNHLLQQTQPHNGKENRLFTSRPKEKSQTLRKPKANKHKKHSKNRRGFSIKNTTQVISRAVASNAQEESKNEPVTHKWGNSVRQTENYFTLYSERCEPSLPVIPGLVRKAQKKNSLKCTLLSRQQTIKQHAKKEASDCDRDNIPKAEDYPENSDLPIWDYNPLYYSTDCENNMLWSSPSSPSLNITSTTSILQKQQQDLISVFFDSSDNSN